MINQYESGERKITVPVTTRLKDAFGITLDWIYAGDPSGLPKRIADRLLKAA